MSNSVKLEMLQVVKNHIQSKPKITYADLVAELKMPQLSTVQFYNIKAGLRKKGLLPDKGHAKVVERSKPEKMEPRSNSIHIEILESIDISGFSSEILNHYRTHIIELLRKVVPNGKTLRMAVLSDPPILEIQRVVS